ncbi:DUF362 domain-containing protein, partial [Acidobacteriota bacterium]
MRDNTVAICRVGQDLEAAVRTALQRVGGLGSLIDEEEDVFLKPNFVAPRDSSRGVTTNLEIVRVVAEEVRRCGGTPVIFETPALEFEGEKVFAALGVYEFAKRHGIRLIEGPVERMKIPVPGGKVFKSLEIPGFLHHAKIINLPKLKTHVSAGMTCGIKNLIGLLSDRDKRRVHMRGIHSPIADLARAFRPILTLVDATTCMEGDGPTYGDRVDLGLIVSGRDMVSVDSVCGRIIGLPEDEPEYLRRLRGGSSPEGIEIVGESIDGVGVSLSIPRKSALYHAAFRVIHALDSLTSRIFPTPLTRTLYHTGHFGTNPTIIEDRCNRCGDCLEVCPEKNALDIEGRRV